MTVARHVAQSSIKGAMDNITLVPVAQRHRHDLWLADVIIVATATLTSCYVMVASATHGAQRFESASAKGRSRPVREKRLATFTRALSGIIALMSVAHGCVKLWNLALQHNAAHSTYASRWTKNLCQVLPRTSEFVISIATGLCYLFLWARQSVFYLNPSLAALNNSRVKFFSYSVFVFWLAYYIPIATVQVVLVKHEYATPGGCIVVHASLPVMRIVLISWAVVSCAMQLVLLWLFVNPILNRTSIRGQRGSKSAGPSRSYMRIYRRVKRAFVLTGICLLSDVIATVVTITIFNRETNNLTALYSLNLCINLLATVGCFDNWRGMLCPWCRSSKKGSVQSVQTTSITQTTPSNANPNRNPLIVNDVSIVSSREM